MTADGLLYLVDLLGVGVFAVSGALAAGRKRLDLLGVVVLALVTAIGGGTVRDVLLDRSPVFWVADPVYVLVITGAALGTVVWTRRRRPPLQALAVADALGLAFFAIAGAWIAEGVGVPAVSAAVLGVVTGVVGGMIRDVLTAEVPLILRHGELYATAALAGTALYLVLQRTGLPAPWPSLVGMAAIVGLRFASIFGGLRIPVFSVGDEPGAASPTEAEREGKSEGQG